MPVSKENVPYYEIVILGAGFSGCKAIYEARKRNLTYHVFEAVSDLGGTWRNNRYPGARVDSWTPIYQLDIPEVYNTWKYSEKFPGQVELCKYFDHLEEVLHLKKDITFNTFISEATFDTNSGLWTLKDANGKVLSHSKYFLPCIGFCSKKYTPEYEGFEKYTGQVIHSSDWPEGVDLSGKTVAVMGTGSTGVQIVQTLAPVVKELFVYQRTPNLTLPMNQTKNPFQDIEHYDKLLPARYNNPTGFDVVPIDKDTKSVSKEEREAAYAEMFKKGGFHFWISNYRDMLTNQEANDIAYAYWRDETRKRIRNKDLWEDLAPTKPPHPFGTKRPSLEMNYYEQYDRPNVHLENIKKNPIARFNEKGIELADGSKQEFEVMIFATGFDAITGSFKNIHIPNVYTGENLGDSWKNGCRTYMGISIRGYPNMYFTYGPQSPTAFSNGPSCVEKQLSWIFDTIEYTDKNGYKYLDAKEEKQEEYGRLIAQTADQTLYVKADSWYMGANIPGKKVEMLNWVAGVDKYGQLLDESAKSGWAGFVKVA